MEFLLDLGNKGAIFLTDQRTRIKVCKYCKGLFETKKGKIGAETAGNSRKVFCFDKKCAEDDKEYWAENRREKSKRKNEEHRSTSKGKLGETLYPCKCGNWSVNIRTCPMCLSKENRGTEDQYTMPVGGVLGGLKT